MSEMPKLKDRTMAHSVMIGEAGYAPESGRKPVDTRRLVRACDVEECWLPASQMHGFVDARVYTCDTHADAVMCALVSQVFGVADA